MILKVALLPARAVIAVGAVVVILVAAPLLWWLDPEAR